MSAPRDPATLIQADIPPFAGDPAKVCTTVDPEVFFPPMHGDKDNQATLLAKKVCGPCPLRAECAEWAIETKQSYGIWGATTPNERAAIRKRRRAA